MTAAFHDLHYLCIEALPIGLRHNLRDELAQRKQPTQYDIITNIGTTEHVRDNQTAVWANLWQCLKPGGWLVCCTPLPGDWWWHGEWYPTPAFYEQLAMRNGMAQAWISQYGPPPRRCLSFRARKPLHAANAFTMPDPDTLVYKTRCADTRQYERPQGAEKGGREVISHRIDLTFRMPARPKCGLPQNGLSEQESC